MPESVSKSTCLTLGWPWGHLLRSRVIATRRKRAFHWNYVGGTGCLVSVARRHTHTHLHTHHVTHACAGESSEDIFCSLVVISDHELWQFSFELEVWKRISPWKPTLYIIITMVTMQITWKNPPSQCLEAADGRLFILQPSPWFLRSPLLDQWYANDKMATSKTERD